MKYKNTICEVSILCETHDIIDYATDTTRHTLRCCRIKVLCEHAIDKITNLFGIKKRTIDNFFLKHSTNFQFFQWGVLRVFRFSQKFDFLEGRVYWVVLVHAY